MKKDLLNGRFSKIGRIGEGAVSEVFEAEVRRNCAYASAGQRVAIKRYKPWVTNLPNQGARIRRELRAGLRVASEHVVRTYELGSDKGELLLVMELIRGPTLSQWIKENSPADFPSIVRISSEIVEGIAALHSCNLIHRDIKPDNVMITSRGAVVMDLGVVKNLNPAYTINTEGKFIGTIRYAAQEYLFDEPYDSRVDTYSFGLVLYELIFGRPLIDSGLPWAKQIIECYQARVFSDSWFDKNAYARGAT